MEHLTLSVLYLQGSDAGQKYIKIKWIFNFAVPLWLTRIRSDLVTTQDCSPTPHELFLRYSNLHLEYFWRTSCYMYPRIRSDLVTTQACSPTPHELFLRYSNLHLEYFWRTSCYMYPLRMINIDPHSLYFSCIYPKFDRLVWLQYACPCLPNYRVGRYVYVACAQKIWSS